LLDYLYHENGGSKALLNVVKHLPVFTAYVLKYLNLPFWSFPNFAQYRLFHSQWRLFTMAMSLLMVRK